MIKLKPLLVGILIPLAIGGVSAFLTGNSMDTFGRLEKPPLSPPGWLFPVVWTILYLLMGVASYLVFRSNTPRDSVKVALTVYGAQLVVNFLWPIFFFKLEWYLFAFFWLVLLWLLILITTVLFYRISKPAGYLLLPYLLWVSFAGYLNFGVYLLNQSGI